MAIRLHFATTIDLTTDGPETILDKIESMLVAKEEAKAQKNHITSRFQHRLP